MRSHLFLFAITLSDTALWFSANGATPELHNKSSKPFDPRAGESTNNKNWEHSGKAHTLSS